MEMLKAERNSAARGMVGMGYGFLLRWAEQPPDQAQVSVVARFGAPGEDPVYAAPAVIQIQMG